MKKLILLLLFVPLVSFGQVDIENNVEVNVNSGLAGQGANRGLKNLGKGIYSITNVAGSSWVSIKKVEKRARQEVIDFSTSNNYNYEIVTVERFKGNLTFLPKVIITFQVTNQDGSVVISKDEATKRLLELKNFLDLGIITQEEFDERAEPLKKIILD
jgi:hypothetical protein